MPGKHISLLIHFVWSTAGRAPLITPEWRDRLYGYIGGVLKHKRAKLIGAGGVTDHIHVYASLPSTVTVAEMVNAMKANSSRWVHETFPGRQAFTWQQGYGAFSVSKSAEAQVIEYIHNQEAHHRRRDFKTEFLTLLKKHCVEYNELPPPSRAGLLPCGPSGLLQVLHPLGKCAPPLTTPCAS